MPAIRAFGPFDYPDTRTDTARTEERTEVARQVASLRRVATDAAYRRAAVDRLQGRRRGRAECVQIEAVARPGKVDLLAAADSVLARRADLTAAVRARLAGSEVSCGSDERRMVRLGLPAGVRAAPITSVVRSLCDQGAPAELNHVVLLAGVIKGAGGPEPSAGRRPFPAVRYERAPDAPLPVVAVLDTGVSAEVRGDGYLAMTVSDGDLDHLDVFEPRDRLDAGAGHGAFVAGIVQQVAPDAEIRIRRVLDTDGITSDLDVAEEMRAAVAAGAQILNMSLGTETVDGRPPAALLDVVSELAETHPDVLIVCAAGNGASSERSWPAAFARDFPNVVAVAALDPNGERAPWSSHGDWVTCSAIGEGVVSTYVTGREDCDLTEDPYPDTYGPDAWATWSGTSFAAPQITGAIVRICGETGLSPRVALRNLLARGTSIPGYGSALRILPGT